MLARVIIVVSGAGLASYCIIIPVLTILGKNPATLHLSKLFLIGYTAINAVLTPFGISGVIGGVSRKKSLIRAFITYQWWFSTFALIGLNIFNIILAKRDRSDFINNCKANFAKSNPNVNFSAKCGAMDDAIQQASMIEAISIGGVMLFLGIVLLISGTRECNNISLEEETKRLIERNFKDETDKTSDPDIRGLDNNNNNDMTSSPDTYNDLGRSYTTNIQRQPSRPNVDLSRRPPINVNNNYGRYNTNIQLQPSNDTTVNVDLSRYPNYIDNDLGRYTTNVRQPTRSATVNVDLTRQPSNVNTNFVQNSGLIRSQTDPVRRNQKDPSPNFIPPSSYDNGLSRNQTISKNIPPKISPPRYPNNIINEPVNVTRKPTIGNTYTSSSQRNYFDTSKQTYPITPQRSISKNEYINPPSLSYANKVTIPTPIINKQNIGSEDYNNYYV